MIRLKWILATLGIIGLGVLLMAPLDSLAQWGTINSGINAARRAAQPPPAPAPSRSDGVHNVADEATAGPGIPTTTTFRNRVRPFSYTIPAGWRAEGQSDPTGERVNFMKPGTTLGFIFHFTQMVPSFPREAAVSTSLKHAKEEITIGKLLTAKRRDQGPAGKAGVIGWEIVESPKGGGGHRQRIIYQCYDGQNYYYNFMTAAHPSQFEANRAVLQQIIDSVKFH